MNDTTDRLVDLCGRLRDVVVPSLGLHAARDHAGVAVGGDVTFSIDEDAEALLESTWPSTLPEWAFYSEDRGLQGAPDAELILVVDPIDGTRPAAAGFEMACVSVAAVPPWPAPTMGDVVAGVVQEIKTGDLFVAEKGAGLSMMRATASRSRCCPRHAPISRASSGRSASAAVRPSSSRASWRSSSTSPRWAAACSTSARPPTASRASSPGSSTPTSTSDRRSSPRTRRSRPSSAASAAATCSATRPTTSPRRTCCARRPGLPFGDAAAARSTTGRCSARRGLPDGHASRPATHELQAALVDVVQRGIAGLRRPDE